MVTAETISTIGWTMGKIALNTAGGVILGSTLFGIAGGYIGFKAGKSDDPCKDGQMLTTLAGAGIGAYCGANIGEIIGLTGAVSGVNLLTTPFKSIVNGVANIVGNNGIAGYTGSAGSSAISGASHLGSVAAAALKSAIIYNQVTLGVAVTAAIVGYTAYSLYKKTTLEQREQAYETITGIFQSKLTSEERLLEKRFESFESILKAAPHREEVQKANDQLLIEYNNTGDIKIETVTNVRDAYQKAFKNLGKEKLTEISDKSTSLMLSIGKCSRLRENEQSKNLGRAP